ncbi:MAG: molecular chaperone HtpG [Betaproteobacteria bacterium RIFCSPLOWO2_12_FULL_65_14]|nr:MAG: molecular chaperone HtpG [Betaproteobacteria bacterium RIFCSPLOWO2_12_FULL_65_14]
MSTATAKQTLSFQAEVKQLLDLMIRSLYSNKEIFLRELVSNASDAADKLRFEALKNNALYESDAGLKIVVSFDKEARTLAVSDNGIGMSREEVIQNIGTIARSGTREFFQSLTGDQAKDARLIGQFGVGFYSSFIVADRVTLLTRRAGVAAGEAVRWECEMGQGAGEYSIEAAEKPARGTEVTLHLREGEDELLGEHRLKSILRKYSDHIAIPIVLNGETVNQASALWVRPKNEITEEQYVEFYKHVGHDFEAPLAWTHNRVEGRQEYTQLLYIPAHAQFDLWDRQHRHGLKLYVRRVFIMDDAAQLLPAYLRFVRGVVDSSDLPLNVSREILQQSRDIDAMRAGCTKRVLDLLEDLATRRKDKYASFWKEFGRVLKEGAGEDSANRGRLAKLLRFSSTHDDQESEGVSLADYVARMKPGQDKIYYVTAESFLAAKHSPHLEIFRKRAIEVLLLHDRVDEWLVAGLTEYEGKTLVSVARGHLDLGKIGTEGAKDEDHQVGEHAELLRKLKAALGDKVKDVRISERLTQSPSCLVADEHDMGGNLARILKAAGQNVPQSKPILEVNPAHAIVRRLKPGDERFADWASLLFDQALLAEGGQLDDPAGFVTRTNELMLGLARS